MANKIESALNRLVDDLRAAHGDNLASIVLYGSVAAGDHLESRANYNLLIALHRIALDDLHSSQSARRMCFPSSSCKWSRPGRSCTVQIPSNSWKSQAQTSGIRLNMSCGRS